MHSKPVRFWAGDDWEAHGLRLLGATFGPGELQEVPARDRGDLGIDAFNMDGEVFQCYAAEEPLSISDLYAKQRKKMTEDLAKLESKASEIAQLLGGKKIVRWIFLVPRFDSKRLIAHAAKKSKELREKNLSHLHGTFEVVIVTESSFAPALMKLLEAELDKVSVDVPEPTDEEIDALIESKLELVKNMDVKLSKLPGMEIATNLEATRRALLVSYIRKRVMETDLWNRLPSLGTNVETQLQLSERMLPLRYGPAAGDGLVPPAVIAQNLIAEIDQVLPGYTRSASEDLAWGSICDWLMRCPLDWTQN